MTFPFVSGVPALSTKPPDVLESNRFKKFYSLKKQKTKKQSDGLHNLQ